MVENEGRITKIAILNQTSKEIPTYENWMSGKYSLDRLERRELDVLINRDSMETFVKRNKIIYGVRKYLQERGFVEAELPILKKTPDVAPAPHFEVSNVEGNGNLYLRTTFPPFERLLLSFDRAYTLGPNFRKGDSSRKNIPEFNMLCITARGKDYLWSYELLKDMIASVAQEVNGNTLIRSGESFVDICKGFARMGFQCSCEFAQVARDLCEIFRHLAELQSGFFQVNQRIFQILPACVPISESRFVFSSL